jgi:hypothetical protein
MKKKLLLGLLLLSTMAQAQNVGINTAAPDASSLLDLTSTDRGLLVPRISIGDVSLAAPVTAPATSLLVYNTNAAITGGSGVGFYYWNGTSWSSLGKDAVDNGLYYNAGADRIRLGGALVENTLITQGVFGMTYNLSSTGDFTVQDAGVSTFEVQDNGSTYFGDDVFWNDANTAGTTLARLYDSGDDGVFEVFMNGALQHRISSIGTTIFNEQAADVDFRIESITNPNMFYVDASTDRVGIGTSTPTEALEVVGNVEFSGSLEPNALPGTAGQVLLSAGTGVAPTWGVNLGGISELSRWIYPPTNINANTTYTITAIIPGVTASSTAIINLYGDWAVSPGANITIHHVEARTGAVRFIVRNSSATNYLGMDFIVTVIR